MVPQLLRTDVFDLWLRGLRDFTGRARIGKRIKRLASGNPGDVRPVGKSVSELRIDSGSGYRACYAANGDKFILLLAGADKSAQARDIATTVELWKDRKETRQ